MCRSKKTRKILFFVVNSFFLFEIQQPAMMYSHTIRVSVVSVLNCNCELHAHYRWLCLLYQFNFGVFCFPVEYLLSTEGFVWNIWFNLKLIFTLTRNTLLRCSEELYVCCTVRSSSFIKFAVLTSFPLLHVCSEQHWFSVVVLLIG